jgi:cytochrome P450
MSSRNFADPEKFAPERWMKDAPKKYAGDNKKAMQQFSVGPMNGIGRKYVITDF